MVKNSQQDRTNIIFIEPYHNNKAGPNVLTNIHAKPVWAMPVFGSEVYSNLLFAPGLVIMLKASSKESKLMQTALITL